MKEISAKNLLDIFCEKFAASNNGLKPFPTTLIIEFINGTEIVFYSEESEWYKMSSSSIKIYYSNDIEYNYAYEQRAIILKLEYDYNSIYFENIKNQFKENLNDIGFSYVNSIELSSFRHIITLTHFENLILQTPNDFENLVYNHTLNSLLNSYTQYQKPIFSKFSLDKEIHTFVLRWWESNLSYNLHYGLLEAKVNFENVLYIENDIQLMLKHTRNDQEAFFSIWLILYKVCIKLQEALANHPMFIPNFKCYPTFFDYFKQNDEYSRFAKKHKDLDTDKYIRLLLKELKKPEYF